MLSEICIEMIQFCMDFCNWMRVWIWALYIQMHVVDVECRQYNNTPKSLISNNYRSKWKLNWKIWILCTLYILCEVFCYVLIYFRLIFLYLIQRCEPKSYIFWIKHFSALSLLLLNTFNLIQLKNVDILFLKK